MAKLFMSVPTIPLLPPILVSESLRGPALFGKGIKIRLGDTLRFPRQEGLHLLYIPHEPKPGNSDERFWTKLLMLQGIGSGIPPGGYGQAAN